MYIPILYSYGRKQNNYVQLPHKREFAFWSVFRPGSSKKSVDLGQKKSRKVKISVWNFATQ